MNLLDIRLYEPQSLEEAVELLERLEGARLLAGGTDLLVDIKEGTREAAHLVSLARIGELRGIELREGRIRIGPMVTAAEIMESPIIQRHLPCLVDAARVMASPSVRAQATIGGNIASAVPSADLPPGLIAAGASITLFGGWEREVPLLEFFRGPRETACGPSEILAQVHVPLPPPGTGVSYQKMALREANALAVAGVASRLTLEGRKIKEAAVVLGAVAPTPLLAMKASRSLLGREPSEEFFHKAASLAREEGKPISDIRGSEWYRKELTEILTRRSLAVALRRARDAGGG